MKCRVAICVLAVLCALGAALLMMHRFSSRYAFQAFVSSYKQAKSDGAVEYNDLNTVGRGSFSIRCVRREGMEGYNYSLTELAESAANALASHTEFFSVACRFDDSDERYCAYVLIDVLLRRKVAFAMVSSPIDANLTSEDFARIRPLLLSGREDVDENIRLIASRLLSENR